MQGLEMLALPSHSVRDNFLVQHQMQNDDQSHLTAQNTIPKGMGHFQAVSMQAPGAHRSRLLNYGSRNHISASLCWPNCKTCTVFDLEQTTMFQGSKN